MREILFTGKRKDNGEWVQGDFCSPCNIVFLENGYDAVLGNDDSPMCNDYEVIPETVGQYTGLPDKNGNKIFEGHILKWTNVDGDEVYTAVGFKNGCFVINPKREDMEVLYDYLCLDMEIAGNIYDNPELLK